MAKYANYQKVCDCIFVMFTILWIVTRTGVYPFWIIYRYVSVYLFLIHLNIYFINAEWPKLIMYYSTSIEAPKIVPMFPAYYIFNSLLILLLLLHLIWTYLILKIAYNSFNAGQVRGVDLYKLSRARSLRHFFDIDE